jgi:hypothetical protein
MRLVWVILLLVSATQLRAQTAIYVPYQNVSLWSADTLYVGASFYYMGNSGKGFGKWKGWSTLDPINVTLVGNAAGWKGELWANVEDLSTGGVDRVYLFNNFDPIGTMVDLRTLVPFTIQTNAQITFEYLVVVGCGPCWPISPDDFLPKYSGPNRGSDRFVSKASSDDHPNPNWRYGNRWSVVGRLSTGVLEFGFEDCTETISDMDFDDVMFQVTNLEMGVFTRRLLAKDLVR